MRSPVTHRWLAAAMTAFVLFFAVAAPASGQQRRQRPEAITDPAQAGADFGLQGEYAGWLFFPGRGSHSLPRRIHSNAPVWTCRRPGSYRGLISNGFVYTG